MISFANYSERVATECQDTIKEQDLAIRIAYEIFALRVAIEKLAVVFDNPIRGRRMTRAEMIELAVRRVTENWWKNQLQNAHNPPETYRMFLVRFGGDLEWFDGEIRWMQLLDRIDLLFQRIAAGL